MRKLLQECSDLQKEGERVCEEAEEARQRKKAEGEKKAREIREAALKEMAKKRCVTLLPALNQIIS